MGSSKDQNLHFFAGAHILLAIKHVYDSHDHTILFNPPYYLLSCSVKSSNVPKHRQGCNMLGLTSFRAAVHRR